MSDSYFLDSNIIVYLFDSSQARKQKRAEELFEQAHESKNGFISIQVVQEFTNVVTRKFATPLTFLDLQSFILTGLRPLCRVHTDVNLLIRALRIRDSSGYSFYDALIVAAALQAGCTRLYSEDLQNGQMIETLTVVNPFE